VHPLTIKLLAQSNCTKTDFGYFDLIQFNILPPIKITAEDLRVLCIYVEKRLDEYLCDSLYLPRL